MTRQASLTARAWAELLLLALIWGGVFLAVTVALREVPVFTLVAYRVAGGALILWLYILWRRIPVPKSPRIWGAFALMGVLNNALPFSLIAWGQLHIDAGLSAIINGSTAIFAVLVAAAIFADERLTPNRLAGVVLGFFGVAIAVGISALRNFDITSLAQPSIVGASVSYAFAAAWARAQFKDVAPQVAAAGMTLFSGAIMVTVALLIDGAPAFSHSAPVWGALAYMAAMGTAVAYLLYYRVLATAGSGNLMLVTLLIPPVAIGLGAVILGQALPPRALVGFGILAAGMVIMDGRILRLWSRAG